jgi:hypothetical protein
VTIPTLTSFFTLDGVPAGNLVETIRTTTSRMAESIILPGLPTGGFWADVGQAVTRTVPKALNLNLTELLVGGWNTSRKVLEAAERSKSAPQEIIPVSLGHHTITSSHRPAVEVWVGGKKVMEVLLKVQLELEIETAILTIQQAKIKEAALGKCLGSGTLSCEGAMLIERTAKPILLPGRIRFGDGIPILGSSTR